MTLVNKIRRQQKRIQELATELELAQKELAELKKDAENLSNVEIIGEIKGILRQYSFSIEPYDYDAKSLFCDAGINSKIGVIIYNRDDHFDYIAQIHDSALYLEGNDAFSFNVVNLDAMKTYLDEIEAFTALVKTVSERHFNRLLKLFQLYYDENGYDWQANDANG